MGKVDYALPLLTARSLSLSGPLILAEQSVSNMFSLQRSFAVGETVVVLTKTLAPILLFHSLRIDIDTAELSYGPDMLQATGPPQPMLWLGSPAA